MPRKTIHYFAYAVFCTLLFINPLQAKTYTVNKSVKIGKPTIVYSHWLNRTYSFNKEKHECRPFRPPTILITKKPKLGTVKTKKGAKFDSAKNSICKGEKVTGTTVEYTAKEKGKDSFKIQIRYRETGYYDEVYGMIIININAR